MNTSDVLAVVAIILSALSAGFTFWQARIAKEANEHAADSADSARISAEAAQSQDRRDAERALREQTGWLVQKTGELGVYVLENASDKTAYFLPHDKDRSIQLLKREPNLVPGESAMFTIKSDDGTTPTTVSLFWNDGNQFRERTITLPVT